MYLATYALGTLCIPLHFFGIWRIYIAYLETGTPDKITKVPRYLSKVTCRVIYYIYK